MSYAICFDFPEETDPVFAGWYHDTMGFVPTLGTARLFDSETVAERTLKNGRPVDNGAQQPDTVFEKLGHMLECQTELEHLAADLDDDDVSQAVFLVRLRLTSAGNLLARRRNVS